MISAYQKPIDSGLDMHSDRTKEMDVPRGRQVLLVPFTLQGHVTPMLQLGKILHTQGFAITVLHPEYNFPNRSDHPEFTLIPLADNFSGTDASSPDPFLFISAMNNNCRQPLQENIAKLQGNRIACVIHGSLMEVVESVAREYNIPSIILRTSSAANLLSYFTILGLLERHQILFPESQLEGTVPALDFLRFKDLPFPVHAEIPEIRLQFMRTSLQTPRSSKAVIFNSTESLEGTALSELQNHYQIPFFSIGPIHEMTPSLNPTSIMKEDVSCIQWLDKREPNSAIYVSLGSLAKIDKEELLETAWGLVQSEQPFLWVVRPNSVNGSDWIEFLPDELIQKIPKSGCIVKWGPQREILIHGAVGAFWSHCGWNSTMEAITAGVPMLCQPCFGDQLVNARYISHVWRVGLELQSSRDRTIVMRGIRRLMVDEEGKDIRRRCIAMKRKLEDCVQKGSSCISLGNLTQFILSLKP